LFALTLLYVAFIGAFFVVYAWSLYNLPILAAGVRNLRKARRMSKKKRVAKDQLPTFSIVVPVKNEGKVVGRLLEALAKLDYPAGKQEVIIVEDGSTDRTLEICSKFAEARQGSAVKILQKPSSDGKSSALNYGIRQATGDFVAVFDADSVPAADVLLNVSRYFDDPSVAAVQGKTLSINSEENMLTKFIAYEDVVWCEAYLRGKDVLNLFVHLRGSCQFIKRSVLEELAGFDERILSEDMELSARLTEKGYRIRYASDACSWQETPASLKGLVKQRTRWFRGTMEVAFKYGRLMAKPSMRSFDAEATLFGPFILLFSLLTYFAAFFSFFVPFPLGSWWQMALQFTALSSMLTLFLCGLALVYASKPRKVTNVFWLPFIYFYWSLQTLIALHAVLLIVLRRPGKWVKTEKTGSVKTLGFGKDTELESC
jgi:cellulose synthase/poly-beta-1,6-N-acetylglucosamine synthase-like glycosyltransferase